MSDTSPEPGRTVAIWSDINGDPCEPGPAAVHGEIIEYDADNVELQRTYLEPPEPGAPVIVGEAPHEPGTIGAWTYDMKTQWDVRDTETQELVVTLDSLAQLMGWVLDGTDPDSRHAVAQFTTLPSYAVAPEQLKDEVQAWLTATR